MSLWYSLTTTRLLKPAAYVRPVELPRTCRRLAVSGYVGRYNTTVFAAISIPLATLTLYDGAGGGCSRSEGCGFDLVRRGDIRATLVPMIVAAMYLARALQRPGGAWSMQPWGLIGSADHNWLA